MKEASVAENLSDGTSACTVAWTSSRTDSCYGRNPQDALFFTIHNTGKETRELEFSLAEAEGQLAKEMRELRVYLFS